MNIDNLKNTFLEYLNRKVQIKEPQNLYEPLHYILQLGGKRLRPTLTLLSCDLFGGKYHEALDAALAVEMFHNFSLIHDDIMDNASLRRGKLTVHEKWDLNTGILSGDALMIMAYQLFENYEPKKFKALAKLFSKTAIEVCEGQQYDIDFETSNDVSIQDYLKMITLKTAVLVAASLKMGAIIAGVDNLEATKIYDYGLNLGIAFQLQDDYLDVFGQEDFGKKHAGDIIENKKTWMYLRTLELADIEDKSRLLDLFRTKKDDDAKIKEVINLFKKYKIPELIKSEIIFFTKKALHSCNELLIEEGSKKTLINFASDLMSRKI